MLECQKFQAPHIIATPTTPQHQLEHSFYNHRETIEIWLQQQATLTPPPITCSVDLRNAGFKVAPIDTNLFPAGFNNLNLDFIPLAVAACQATLRQHYPQCERILLIPENHTRNMFYFENLAMLHEIIRAAGYQVRIGSLLPEITMAKIITLPSGRTLTLEAIQRHGDHLHVDDFIADIIILNNDISGTIPPLLHALKQPILPELRLTWAKRLKSTHFSHYNHLANTFAQLIAIDPWLITPLFSHCSDVDFLENIGSACLIQNAEQLFTAMHEAYRLRGISQKPFVVIKADAGSYGMGVMMIYHENELKQLNRKQRTRMSSTKSGQPITRVILQEGIPSIEVWSNVTQATSEPVVYMLGRYVIGGFYRMHAERSQEENLNSPGMQFQALAFADCCNKKIIDTLGLQQAQRLYVYGVLARLAAIAAAREIQETANAH